MSNPDLNELTTLQLGDIISFDAPVNPDLHDRVFLIKYIDNGQITVVDEETLKELTLSLDDDGNLTDQSVEAIAIIDRVDEPGYAKQNDLVPGKWVNLRFGGDIPVVITGEITNLEEDMIEIKTHPDGDIIYLDFAYKGIPKDLPIEKIEIRGTPDSAKPSKDDETKDELATIEDGDQAGEMGDGDDGADVEDIGTDTDGDRTMGDVNVPIADVKAQLREMIIGADQIQIGADLGVIEQEVDVEEGGVRYGIEKQVNDMLDDMLSTIPNAQRTQSVLSSIHQMIDRFVELRKTFSKFDEQGNASAADFHGPSYKPLVSQLLKLNHNILWLLPIAKNRKKLFVQGGSEGTDDDEEMRNEGVINLTMGEREGEISDILQTFKDNRSGDGQNKYDYMVQQLNGVLAPFQQPLSDDGVIDTRAVDTNLSAVIDNLGDLYSMTVHHKNTVATRFLITKYELGEDKLKQTRLRNGQLDISRVNITNPQNIALKGLLTLPEHVSRFSRVNMPRTNIMLRSELAQRYVNYWQLLRKSTNLQKTVIENLDDHVDYDKMTFLTQVRSYVLDTSLVEGSSEGNYERFLEAVIPKTRVLFELVKRHIKNAYSLHAVLDYLEPFFVYHKDLSFKQYEAMTGFIRGRIKDYKKTLADARKEMLYIQTLDMPGGMDSGIMKLLDLPIEEEERLFSLYGILTNDPSEGRYISNENDINGQLFRMMSVDNCNAVTSLISAAIVDLMVPDGEMLADLSEDIQEAQRELSSIAGEGNCSKYTIAKKYVSMDELEEDSNADVYFDKRFDKTDYGLLKKYGQEKKDMGDNFAIFLADKIRSENAGMTPDQAEREVRAIMEGRRLVEEGDFAVLVTDGEGDDGVSMRNYERKGGMWVPSDVSENLLPTMDLGAFCAAQPKCTPNGETCNNTEALLVQSEVDTLKDSIKFFAELYPKRREQLKSHIELRKQNALRLLGIRELMEFKNATKYTRENFLIGETAVASDAAVSPFAPLRDLILSQGDFVKKQYDILRFAARFTFLKKLDDGSDDVNWLYCTASGVKLLPSYMETLAEAFVNYPDTYVNALETVCAERGTISDDGENWVDKHSGYVICPIQYDSEEGYTAQGFKVKTRAQMEADLGDAVLLDANKEREFEGKDANMVAGAVRALALIMGVNMNSHIEFIVRNVLIKQKATMVPEDAYERLMERAAKAGKKRNQVSYEDAYVSNMLYLMFCYYVVAMQSSIPEIKTNKTFPGCKRAFGGYPIDGTTDTSAIAYVACLVKSLSKGMKKEQPWKSVSEEKEVNIMKRIQAFMDKNVIADPEIQEMFSQKKEYLQTQVQEDIPVEHDIRSWTNFLPPLVMPEVAQLQPLAKDFRTKFIGTLTNGSMDQFKFIGQAQARAMDYSVAIQTLVQKVVSSHKALLNNAGNEPFLQNACCETTAPICLDYFADRESDIKRYNDIVKNISEMLNGAGVAAKAALLYDPRDTRTAYPPIAPGFSEDTIYQAVITFCRFNNALPVAPDLLPICHEKPADLNINDSMDELIAQLKKSGRVYTKETLDALMAVINKEHTVHIDLEPKVISKVQSLRDVLATIGDMSEPVVDKEAIRRLNDVLDVFDVKQDSKNISLETRQIRNHLSSLIKSNSVELESFITQNTGKMSRSEKKHLIEFLKAPTNLPASSATPLLTAEENGVYRDLLLAQGMIRNIVDVIPNMLINEAESARLPYVPKHWGLSMKHTGEIQEAITAHYKKIVRFYGQDSLKDVMKVYYQKHRLLAKLVEHLVYLAPMPGFASITVLDDVTVKLLIDYFLGVALLGFAKLATLPSALETDMAENVKKSRELKTMVDVNTAATGDVDALAIMRGYQQQLREKLAEFLKSVIEVMMMSRKSVDYSYESAMDDVHRVKEKEKDHIVADFAELPDEQREIEDLLKRSKLGKWSKGLKKSVFQYVAEDYDEEREEMERRAERERRVGKDKDVTDMNRDIYMEEMEADERSAEEIDRDAYDMSHIGEDDDDGYDYDD